MLKVKKEEEERKIHAAASTKLTLSPSGRKIPGKTPLRRIQVRFALRSSARRQSWEDGGCVVRSGVSRPQTVDLLTFKLDFPAGPAVNVCIFTQSGTQISLLWISLSLFFLFCFFFLKSVSLKTLSRVRPPSFLFSLLPSLGAPLHVGFSSSLARVRFFLPPSQPHSSRGGQSPISVCSEQRAHGEAHPEHDARLARLLRASLCKQESGSCDSRINFHRPFFSFLCFSFTCYSPRLAPPPPPFLFTAVTEMDWRRRHVLLPILCFSLICGAQSSWNIHFFDCGINSFKLQQHLFSFLLIILSTSAKWRRRRRHHVCHQTRGQ